MTEDDIDEEEMLEEAYRFGYLQAVKDARLTVEKWLHNNKKSCIHEFEGLSEAINKLKG